MTTGDPHGVAPEDAQLRRVSGSLSRNEINGLMFLTDPLHVLRI